jgi:hypothetical protein
MHGCIVATTDGFQFQLSIYDSVGLVCILTFNSTSATDCVWEAAPIHGIGTDSGRECNFFAYAASGVLNANNVMVNSA